MWRRNISWLSFRGSPTGDQTCSLSMWPDWGSKGQPFVLWGDAHPTEPHWPGQESFIIFNDFISHTFFYNISFSISNILWIPPSNNVHLASFLKNFFEDFIYLLILERGEGWEKEREGNINVWFPLTLPLLGTLDRKPRHVARLGIKPATLWFVGQHSIHWATPARALTSFLMAA